MRPTPSVSLPDGARFWQLILSAKIVNNFMIRMKEYQYNLIIAVAFGFLLIQLLDRLRIW